MRVEIEKKNENRMRKYIYFACDHVYNNYPLIRIAIEQSMSYTLKRT